MMHDLVYGSAGLVGWIAFAYKLIHLRRDPSDPALRSICAAFGFSAFAFTAVIGPLYEPLDEFLGLPNLAKLFIHIGMVLFSVFALRLLVFWEYPNKQARQISRRIMMIGLAAVGTMVALILLAPIHDSYTIHFWKSFAGETYMLWYLVIFLVSLSIGEIAIAHRAWRFAGHVTSLPWLHRGLRVTAVGACVSLGYCVSRGGYLLASQSGVRLDFLVDLAQPFASVGQIMVFTGLTMPSWGARISDLGARFGQIRAYQALYPLWAALYQAFPDIALHPPKPGSGEEKTVGDLDYRLYRRMVEIWDGQLDLRSHAGPEWNSGAPRHTGDAESLHEIAQAEALAISRALRAFHDQREPGSVPAGGVPGDGGEPPRGAYLARTGGSGGAARAVAEQQLHGNMTDELEWLVAVSRAFAKISPAQPGPGHGTAGNPPGASSVAGPPGEA